jgi:AbrB family looped-hinge helix DNA binding protein
MVTLTITAKGQVTLRKDVLAHLGVRPGKKVEVDLLPDGRVALRAAPQGELARSYGLLRNATRPPLSLAEISQIARDGWSRDA